MMLSALSRTGVAVGATITLALVGLQPAPGALPPTGSPVAENGIVLDEPAPPAGYEDTTMHLTGHLENGKSGEPIVLRRSVGESWERVATTRTDSGGEFGFDFTPVDPGMVDLEATHRQADGREHSATRSLTVWDRHVYIVTEPSYKTFDDIVLTGNTRPRQPGRRIVVQHLIDGTWYPVASGYTDDDGNYAISMRNNLPGQWSVRAFWAGSRPNGGTAEYSLIHRYAVKAVLDPVVTSVTRKELGGSFHDGCPVGAPLLRNVELTFKTFGPAVGRGTLVVRSTIVSDVIAEWGAALSAGFPIRKIFPTAHYGGSDIKSMYHDNTSAFNCRHVTGDPSKLSPHSYGVAIDVDPVENPYKDVHGTWWPRSIGQQYRDRSHPRPGMLYDASGLTKGLKGRGFRWGGNWYHPDYQHFDTFQNKGSQLPAGRRAGPLSMASMPAASALGPGWRRYADPGSAEAGWLGNGSFVHARPGDEAARGVLPLGCAGDRRRQLPSASYALQGAYLSPAGSPGQAVVLQFASSPLAKEFFAGLKRMLLTCTTSDGPSGLVVRPKVATQTTFAGERTYSGRERWAESDVLDGARVTVLLARR